MDVRKCTIVHSNENQASFHFIRIMIEKNPIVEHVQQVLVY